jgi:hypothetical protein
VQSRHASAVVHEPPTLTAEAGTRRRERHPLVDLPPTACLHIQRREAQPQAALAGDLVMSATYEIDAATSPVGPCQLMTPRVREPRASTPRRMSSLTSSVSAPSTSRPLDGAMGALPASSLVFIQQLISVYVCGEKATRASRGRGRAFATSDPC